MAESSTPSGDEQYCIVDELLCEQSNTECLYLVSTSWVFRWMDHVAHVDKLLNTPGKLRMQPSDNCSTTDDEFCNLGGMYPNCDWFGNMCVCETIWCKWVQWYGVDDGHQLDRCTRSTSGSTIPISLKGDMGARVGHTSKVFSASEKCGYIELQLRRIFGVTHDTETQLWVLYGNTHNPLVLDRGKELMHYSVPEVRYDTVF